MHSINVKSFIKLNVMRATAHQYILAQFVGDRKGGDEGGGGGQA